MHRLLISLEPLALYVGAILAFLLSIFWKPRIGLYYLVLLLPMQTVRYWLHQYPFGEKVVDVLLLGVVLGLIFRSERPIFVQSPANKIVILFCVLIYFGLWQGSFYLGAPLPISFDDYRFSDWKNYVEMMFLFFIAAAAIRTPKQMGIVIALMCISVLMVNRSYHDTIGGRDYSQFSENLRDAGPLGYAGENGMGAFQADFAVFSIGLAAFAKKKLHKILLLGVAFTCVYCLVFTFSRGGYLGFLVGLFVLGIVKQRKLLIVLAVFLVGWQGFVPEAVTQRVQMTYNAGQGLDPSAEDRVTIWRDALQVLDHNPVIGTGFDTYRFMGRVSDFQDTHNYYVKVLLENGVVGLSIFLMLLFAAGKMAWRLYANATDPFLSSLGCALFAFLSCAAAVNFFGDRWTFLQVNGFFWVLLGCVARGLLLVKQEQQTSSLAVDGFPLAMEPARDAFRA
jgi:putative inorganic carbon (HCO3(-)) transporter